MTLFRTPAVLQSETQSETAYGGRTGAWTEAARLWVTLTPSAPRPLGVGDTPPETLETATAEARDDLRAGRGQRLIIGAEPPWRVVAIDHARPTSGRMTLRLERTL